MADKGKVTFECTLCGGTEIIIPEDPADDSAASCASCGHVLATWGALRDNIHKQAFEVATDVAKRAVKLRKI